MAEIAQVGEPSAPTSRVEYDAFLSYAHRDKHVTSATQMGLHQIGRRVGQLRALRVFRDDTDLTADPDLWAKITEALGGSRFLIVVLSPQSAASHWVNEEVRHWLAERGHDGLMLVLAEGRLEWDAQHRRFDPGQSTAAPPVLTQPGILPEEPPFIDVSGDAPWDVSSLVFRDKVTSLAALIHGKTKDELIHEDLREQRRFRRLRRAAMAGLAVLTVVALVAGVVAFEQRGKAIGQAHDALAAQLDTKALAIFSRAVADGEIRAIADTLAAQRIRTDRTASAGALYTATAALNTTRRIIATPAAQRSLAVSADRHTMATAGSDGAIRFFDLSNPADPKPVGRPLAGHTGAVTSVAFSPDARTLASGGRDGTIRLWNLVDLAHPQPLGGPLSGQIGSANSVAFSPNGHVLAASGPNNVVRLWDVTDFAHPVAAGPPLVQYTSEVQDLRFSPDGRILVCASLDPRTKSWNVSDPAHAEPLKGLLGSFVASVAFSPDGDLLAAADDHGNVQLYSADDPANLHVLGGNLEHQAHQMNSLAFSADGKTLAGAGAGGDILVWDLSERDEPKRLSELRGHTGAVTGAVFSSDGSALISTGLDDTVRSWSVRAAEPVLYDQDGELLSAAFSPVAPILASGGTAGAVYVLNFADPNDPVLLGEPLKGHTQGIYAVTFSPGRHTLASASFDDTIRLWSLPDASHPAPLGVPLTGHTDVATNVAFSPDGRMLASSSRDGTVRLWSTADPTHPRPFGPPLMPPSGGRLFMLCVAFSPDGHTLAAGGNDGRIRLWDITDPAHPRPRDEQLIGHSLSVNRIAYSPDGRVLASAGDDQTVRLWNSADPAHPQPMGEPLRGHTSSVFSVSFSPDGHTLASASFDHTARMWNVIDPAHPRPLGAPLRGHTEQVTAAVFSPDGRLLVTASSDHTLRLWPTPLDATAELLCSKLTSNISHRQWQDWISPNVGYITLCPNLPVPQD